MEDALAVVVMGRACRNASAIKNRQPIGQMYVKADMNLPEYFIDIIADELNIKSVTFTEDVSAFTTYTFKPQLKTVGPKYGKLLGKIRQALTELDGNAAMEKLKSEEKLTFDFDGDIVELTEEDLLIDMTKKEGYVSENDNRITVVLDTNLTEELIEEGYVREIISKIQTMRKEADFEVTDKIIVYVTGNEKIQTILEKNKDVVTTEVMADDIVTGRDGYTKEWNINGEQVTLGVKR
jgi:isoleucyl-tRNA synthetase